MASNTIRPLVWMGSSKRDYRAFPEDVKGSFGFALYLAQTGGRALHAKPFKSLGGGVVELVQDYDKGTYRAIYTIRFSGTVYVLHAFQKKSKRGIGTTRQDVEMVRRRLRDAEMLHRSRQETR